MKNLLSNHYRYYQPNSLDPKHKYGDCTIRALTMALNLTWLEAFDVCIPFCRKYQCSNIFDTPVETRKAIMRELGFYYTGVSNSKGSKRPTVAQFAANHPEGTYVLVVASHIVAVKDGFYYDTWDSGRKSLYGYFTYSEALANQ